jgi:hypothetical protein
MCQNDTVKVQQQAKIEERRNFLKPVNKDCFKIPSFWEKRWLVMRYRPSTMTQKPESKVSNRKIQRLQLTNQFHTAKFFLRS